jgi:hypothetical protein
MSMKIICVVEGHGEVKALPVLIRRLILCDSIDAYVHIPEPIRTSRDKFLNNQEEHKKVLGLAAAKAQGAPILILLDADDDCPVNLAKDVLKIVQTTISHTNVGVVIADREFESWFLASVPTLSGYRTLQSNLTVPVYSETIRNCKGWLSERMRNRYSEVLDQAAFADRLCPSMAATNSRSFEKFHKVVRLLLNLDRTNMDVSL